MSRHVPPRFRVSLIRSGIASLLLLGTAALLIPSPVAAQDGPPSSTEPALSGQAIGALQPGGSLQLSSSQAGSVQAGEIGAFGLRAHSLDFSGTWPAGSGRAPVLRPIRPARPLPPRLQTTLQQSIPDAQVLQTNARVLQRKDSLQSESASVPPYRRRWDAFRSTVVRPGFVLGSALQGTIMHLTGSPGTWDRDAGGYLARVGSSAGSRLVYTGVRHGVSAALDLRLESPEPQGPLGARLRQAALQELTTRTASGRRVPAVAETSGLYAAILTSRRLHHGQWRPGQAAISTAISTGFKIVWAAGSELVKSL